MEIISFKSVCAVGLRLKLEILFMMELKLRRQINAMNIYVGRSRFLVADTVSVRAWKRARAGTRGHTYVRLCFTRT